MKAAIGDIHGYHRTLDELLALLEPKAGDELFFLGDMIDRGPGSRQVIDRILQLQTDGVICTSLLGNHELAIRNLLYLRQHGQTEPRTLLNELASFVTPSMGTEETAASYGMGVVDFAISLVDAAKVCPLPNAHVEFINSLKFYHVFEKYILVHGGLPRRVFRYRSLETALKAIEVSTWLDCSPLFGERHTMHLQPSFPGIVVHGHTPPQCFDDFIPSRRRRFFNEKPALRFGHWNLDSGIIYGGPLSALLLPEEKLVQVPRVEA